MKTQISKISFDAAKRYSGVYQQQGRMLTDADWNNLIDLLKRQLTEALRDVVGNGSPRNGALTITSDRKIQPGDLYIDGLRAELPGTVPFPVSQQPDLPESANLAVTGPYLVYADVWERSLTALEDPELRDAGLNGADTCTRTQRMLQIKTCAIGFNPEIDIPTKGNAALSLDLHNNFETSDPCDPCAGLVGAGKGRVGNYLFRLEVHAVAGDAANPAGLILKWSSENGAEQYIAQSEGLMPPGFVNSRYLYEFFNLTTERHPGVHLTAGFSPRAGMLKTGYEIPDGAADPQDFVRRWDGYCELRRSGSNWTLAAGWDKGVDLSTGTPVAQPGHVALGPGLTVNLEAFLMNLELSGKIFLAGDYWLAPVREAIHTAGSVVLNGELPRGIEHHYLRLAAVAANGAVQLYANDADRRRHTFPPLTDLHAHDVDYKTDCTKGLFLNFAGTVKQALDEICSIEAKDVGFPKPCDASIYQGKTVETVADALTLLCDIQAKQVSFSADPDCAILQGVKTVNQALNALCKRPTGGGCRVTVGEGGEFKLLEEAINALLERGERNLCICLLAGDHVVPQGLKIDGDAENMHLAISGCGMNTRLFVQKQPIILAGCESFHLKDLLVQTIGSPAGAFIFERCREVTLLDANISGQEGVLITVGGGKTFRLANCLLEASSSESLGLPNKIFSFHPALENLFKLLDLVVFNEELQKVAAEMASLPIDEKKTLVSQIDERVKENGSALSPAEIASYQALVGSLQKKNVRNNEIENKLNDIRSAAIGARPAIALALLDGEGAVHLENDQILGEVYLYGRTTGKVLDVEMIKGLARRVLEGTVQFRSNNADLRVNSCRLTRMTVSQDMVQQLESIFETGGGTVTGLFRNSFLTDNIFIQGNNQLVLEHTQLTSTAFEVLSGVAGFVMGNSSIYMGNRANTDIRLFNLTLKGRTERAANLTLNIVG
jgi:hypothetical protein